MGNLFSNKEVRKGVTEVMKNDVMAIKYPETGWSMSGP